MKVILCTGAPQSGLEDVFGLLQQAGVAAALPASQATLTATELQTKLLLSQEVSLAGTEPLTQVVPGKLWHQLAAELFFANLPYAAWGWADHQSSVLMDFWQDFDPQVRLLLVYNSPQAHLIKVIDEHTPASPALVAKQLQAWTRWNTALLRYHHRHPERCLLVNAQSAGAQPQALVDAIASRWQINGLDRSAVTTATLPAHQALQDYLINQIIDPQHPALTLYQELEGVTLAISAPETQAPPNARDAWESWVQARSRQAMEAQEQARFRQDMAAQAQAQAQAQLADRVDQTHEQLRALGNENEHLMLQLHQAQEELEHYFVRYQAQEQAASAPSSATRLVNDFWRMHQPKNLSIDMRKDVAGSNWYPPEADGRWAGPASLSTLQMPPMQAGDYTLELDIVDAMSLDIVRQLCIETPGQSQAVELIFPLYQGDYPLVCKVPLHLASADADQPWEIGLRFSHTLSPADQGLEDQRSMALRLRSLRLIQHA